MYTKIILIFLISVFSFQFLRATEEQKSEKENTFNVKFSGYIKNDFFYDSRQTVAAREGQFHFWPAPRILDNYGKDINAKASLTFLAIQSRVRVAVSGPQVLGAKPSGLIEADFVGSTNDLIGQVRLRHAFIKLNWERTELLTGQYWNPIFVAGCYPGTVSFNTGVPIQGLARNPQVRITHKVGGLSLIGAAVMQRDFASLGPDGKSSSYLKNAILPEMHAQIHYAFPNIMFGGGISFKSIVPRLTSTVDQAVYKVDESVAGLSALGFIKVTTKPVTMKFQFRYGENNTDLLSISGYAVKEIVNQETQERLYTPLTNTSFWTDIQTNGDRFYVGLFSGIITNHGSKEEIDMELTSDPIIYGFGHQIESLYRISPRAVYNMNNLRLSIETELTVANYGSEHNNHWQPAKIDKVENCRALIAVQYFF